MSIKRAPGFAQNYQISTLLYRLLYFSLTTCKNMVFRTIVTLSHSYFEWFLSIKSFLMVKMVKTSKKLEFQTVAVCCNISSLWFVCVILMVVVGDIMWFFIIQSLGYIFVHLHYNSWSRHYLGDTPQHLVCRQKTQTE